jgi:protein involved in plasmid replication-relaxation
MTVRLTERDRRMLVKCAVCRWLTTDQLKRLYFPQATLNALQKRLRKLAEAGYLRSYREHPTAEAIHALGPKGKPLVEEKGVEVALQAEVPKQIEHLLGLNAIRLCIEMSRVPVIYFFSWQELRAVGWAYQVIPDAVFAVRAPERRAFLVEYDRSTETLEKLVEKLVWYDNGLLDFPFEAVLVITERTRRLDVLSRELRKKDVSATALASTMAEIREAGFFEVPFVDLLRGARRRVLEKSLEQET